MTRFEYVTKNPRRLAELLELAHSDGLVAKGCSMNLLLPPTESRVWESWLEEEYPDDWDEYDRSAEIEEMQRSIDAAAMEELAKK